MSELGMALAIYLARWLVLYCAVLLVIGVAERRLGWHGDDQQDPQDAARLQDSR